MQTGLAALITIVRVVAVMTKCEWELRNALNFYKTLKKKILEEEHLTLYETRRGIQLGM